MLDWTLNEDGTCTLLDDCIEIGEVQSAEYARAIVFAVNKITQEYKRRNSYGFWTGGVK